MIVRYKAKDWRKVRRKFERLFPSFPLNGLYDRFLSQLSGCIIIDIIGFDNLLKEKYPDDWREMTISNIVEKHHGKEAVRLIDDLT